MPTGKFGGGGIMRTKNRQLLVFSMKLAAAIFLSSFCSPARAGEAHDPATGALMYSLPDVAEIPFDYTNLPDVADNPYGNSRYDFTSSTPPTLLATGTVSFHPYSELFGRNIPDISSEQTVMRYNWNTPKPGGAFVPFYSLSVANQIAALLPDGDMLILVGDEGDPEFTKQVFADIDPKIVIGDQDSPDSRPSISKAEPEIK